MNSFNEDGKVWFFYSSYQAGLRLVERNPKTGHLKKNPPAITTVTTSLCESAFAIKGPDYYYLFVSRGICCNVLESSYQIAMGRLKYIKGPYLKKDGENWVITTILYFLKVIRLSGDADTTDFYRKMIRHLF